MKALNQSKKAILDGIYKNYSHPSSLSGIKKLLISAKRINPNITQHDVKQYLKGEDSYTLHRITRKKFARRKIVAAKPKTIISADLADVRNLSKMNKGINYLLILIDVYSRYLNVIPLKKKNADSLLDAMAKALGLNEFNGVSRVFVDRGGEFYNRKLLNYLEKKGIRLYSTGSIEIKASLAERVIRTLKSKIYKYLSTENTLKYIDVLPALVKSYNASPHKGLGKNLTPDEVHNFTNFNVIKDQWHRMYKKDVRKKATIISSLRVHDTVRLSDNLRISKFRPGYAIQNTLEIFRIKTIDKDQYPPLYYLQDLSGENVEGGFYAQELTATTLPEYFPIEIIGKKKIHGRFHYLVRWIGWPEKFVSYVSKEDIKNIKT